MAGLLCFFSPTLTDQLYFCNTASQQANRPVVLEERSLWLLALVRLLTG